MSKEEEDSISCSRCGRELQDGEDYYEIVVQGDSGVYKGVEVVIECFCEECQREIEEKGEG